MKKAKERISFQIALTKGRCPECLADKSVFCPRDNDGQCLECKKVFCAYHLMIHFTKVHFMALDLDHCSTKEKEGSSL